MKNKKRFTICVDFDGVLNTYSGWKGREELYKPREGVYEFLEELDSKFNVVIFTTRDSKLVWDWLKKYHLDFFVDEVTDIKVGAVAYIDDRALKFNGDYTETLIELNAFKTHWETRVARMTEKRYEWCADGLDIWDNQKEERIDYDFPVELNKLHDENDQLKSTLASKSNQLYLLKNLIDNFGSKEMQKQCKEILEK